LNAQLASDKSLREQAIHDPKSFVKNHFDLTPAQSRLVESISEHHWHEISDHLSKVTFENGGTFNYVLKPDADQIPPQTLNAKVETKCEAKAETMHSD
jgi:hypothetical protein